MSEKPRIWPVYEASWKLLCVCCGANAEQKNQFKTDLERFLSTSSLPREEVYEVATTHILQYVMEAVKLNLYDLTKDAPTYKWVV